MKLFKKWINNKNDRKRSEKIRHIVELRRAVSEYFNYENNDVYEFFNYCGITDIYRNENVFYITLKRPGMFIGKGGSTIDGIKKYFNIEYNIRLIEDKTSVLIDSILYSNY